MPVPKYDDLFNPLLHAMHNLGGSASVSEQEDEVVSILKLTEKEASEIHRGKSTKISYRLAWARNYLKRYGLLVSSSRGIWALTPEGIKTKSVDKQKVNKDVKALDLENKGDSGSDLGNQISYERAWEEELLNVIKSMKADSFERLCQRLLRESGFIHVEVTGKSGDGGIDGKGVVSLSGLLSFHMVFQCKKYDGNVSPNVVRDFRGAMVGRADKGLLITTGTFTKEARTEAQRDGAPPIDLVDGRALAKRLKDLRLGIDVKETVVEEVKIDQGFFNGL